MSVNLEEGGRNHVGQKGNINKMQYRNMCDIQLHHAYYVLGEQVRLAE